MLEAGLLVSPHLTVVRRYLFFGISMFPRQQVSDGCSETYSRSSLLTDCWSHRPQNTYDQKNHPSQELLADHMVA